MTFGRKVVLETAPVDPYSLFQGYYVRLRYRISIPDNLPLDGKKLNYVNGKNYYLLLSPDKNKIWQPVRVVDGFPVGLTKNEVVIKGKYRYGSMEYGIEQYYLPENQRQILGEVLREGTKVLVEVKINSKGTAAIVLIKVGGKIFQY